MTDAALHPDARAAKGRSRSTPGIVIGACVLVIAGCGQGGTTSSQLGTTPPQLASSGGVTATAAPEATRPQPEFSSSVASSTSAPAGAVGVEMQGPPPHYMPGGVKAVAGDVTFFLTNRSIGVHTFAIGRGPLQFNGEYVQNTPLVASTPVSVGKSVTFTVYGLPAGSYVIWCTISNHAFEGMKGTLTVAP